MVWNDIPEGLSNAFTYINYGISIIFVLEGIIKIIGLGNKYFKDKWNIFDFIIALLSIVGIILE
jgi:hypothetical protein